MWEWMRAWEDPKGLKEREEALSGITEKSFQTLGRDPLWEETPHATELSGSRGVCAMRAGNSCMFGGDKERA